ncbi:ATP-binding cassette domain-containing protein, partial [Bacteroidota bacterium]|nr:ATP-binding cassette domain-containing protein [Bacteroidota bacterium]
CSQKFLEGTAKVDNFNLNNINKTKIQKLRRNLGIIFQDFKLLEDRNINENLKFILKSIGWKNSNEIGDRIRDTLMKVGLEEKANKMPYELSGGEQQRASIARAIVNNPTLIIADEPTGNLDPKKSIEIVNLLKEINLNGSSVIIATHDYDIIKSQAGTMYECFDKKLKKIDNLS